MSRAGLSVVFAGTPAFAAAHLAALIDSPHAIAAVVTQPDKPGKRGKRLVPSAVKELANAHGLPLLQPRRLNAGDIESFSPDVMVVVAYGQILKRPVLDVPQYGGINVHASLLPRWRGAAPIQRAILEGDSHTGVSIMQMDEGLDTGDVLKRVEIDIAREDTTATLTEKLARIGAPALIVALDSIAAGDIRPEPQGEATATYASKISKEEARIDWQAPAAVIERAVRAFNPDPIAFTTLGDMRVKIWQAEVMDTSTTATPGEIVRCAKQGVDVATGDGTLRILRLQLTVGKGSVMTPSDLLNARRPEFNTGARFGAP